ncbi:MAG: hypothetical protein M3Y74_04295 [Chloroflexota bacterium]|nr:hypothetical protein [Chloroflexota bacterium]
MRIDVQAVLARLVQDLRNDERLTDIEGELTGETRANRPQLRVYFTIGGDKRVFLYHIQREGPVHTVARSLVDDTIRTIPQRIREGITGRWQPNDVYYPSALGNTPTVIPGQASGPSFTT